jgi:beta-lactamase regulating signal transducer with metallopeptidase domain
MPIAEITTPITHWVSTTAITVKNNHSIKLVNFFFLWLAGAITMTVWFALQHKKLIRQLGKLLPQQRFYKAKNMSGGPMLLGVWNPKIIVPENFSEHYSEQQQELILAHERAHAKHGDPLFNSLFAALQCCFWFHPLIHFSVRLFRIDQELACDARVITQFPNTQRHYAEALLKTQSQRPNTAIACQLHSYHPLKERIMLLHQTHLNKTRATLGRWLTISLLGLSAYSAWALSPNTANTTEIFSTKDGAYKLQSVIELDGINTTLMTISNRDEEALITIEGKTAQWNISYTLQPTTVENEQNAILLSLRIKRNGAIVSSPSLLTAIGKTVAVASQDPDSPALDFKLTLTPQLN